MDSSQDIFAENRMKLSQYLLQNRGMTALTLAVNKPARKDAKKLLKANQKQTLKLWKEGIL